MLNNKRVQKQHCALANELMSTYLYPNLSYKLLHFAHLNLNSIYKNESYANYYTTRRS